MSLTAYGDEKGAAGAGGAALQAPKLRTGGYAAWKPDMDVHLARIGADGAHKRAMTKEHWLRMVEQVQLWKDEAMAEALADIGIGAGGASGAAGSAATGSGASTRAALTEREVSTRRTIRLLVEQSTKAYGAIWSALSEDLRLQAAKGGDVPQDFAYGLAQWLEKKFQSTEADSVGELLAQWVALHQEEDESFDAYRARVNHLKTLLEHAKEPQSANMYALMLLDRLQPRYKQAVLALKAGDQMKDASKIAWDTVTAFINAHERNEQRIGAEHGAASVSAAMVNAARRDGATEEEKYPSKPQKVRFGGASSSGGSGSGGNNRGGWSPSRGHQRRGGGSHGDQRTCFRCDQKGHVAAVCPNPPKEQTAMHSQSALARKRGGEQASAAMRTAAGRNRFEPLSSDDEEVEEEWPALRSQSLPCSSGANKSALKAAAKQAMVKSSSEHRVNPDPQKAPASGVEQVQSAPQMEIDTALSSTAWGWDTMASTCCSGNRARFSSLRKCPAVPIKVADGSVVQATHMGSVALRVQLDNGRVVRIVIDNVLYHERFASNLLSGELLTSKKHGWQYHSTPQGTYVVTPGGDRITLSRHGRVSVLRTVEPEVQRAQEARQSESGTSQAKDEGVEKLVRLHQRLNHIGWTRMMFTLRSGCVEDLGVKLDGLSKETIKAAEKQVRECKACLQGKATRTPFGHRGLDRGQRPGECLHMDTYPVKVERDGRMVTEHGLVVKCLYSGYTWHGQLQSKDQVVDAVVDLIKLVETQYGCVVKRLYADGGSEFKMLKTMCQKSGKELRPTPPRTQQLNGGAERTVRTFKDYERMMVLHAGAPVRFWGRAGAHAAFVWNRTHVAKDTGMTPYEAMRGKKPSAKHLAVWGCDAFCHMPKELRDGPMAPKAEPCIYLGHNETQNAATVLLLGSGKIVCSRDVTFLSDSFSFIRALEQGGDDLRRAQAKADEHARSELDDGRDASAPQGGQRDEREYVVERIVSQRRKNGRMEYKVRWAGYGVDEDSWEPEADVRDLAAMDAWEALQVPRAQRRDAAAAHAVQDRADVESSAPARAAPEQPNASGKDRDVPLVPQPALPRRSPRLHASSSALSAETTAASSSQPTSEVVADDEPDAPQVHMAMSAIGSLQLPDERPDRESLMAAVAAGIAMLERKTPRTYREAMAGSDADKWKAARQKEIRNMEEQQVWKLVPRAELPPDANVLPCKEVYKIKVDERGEVAEYKVRFTPKGFRQKRGVDFFETFARTGQYKTLRVALSLAAKWDYELAQFDVPAAFLFADVIEEVYMELPEGYGEPGMVARLLKSLYGLKQAPRNWDKLVHAFITQVMGWKATVSDPSLYFKRSRSGRLMLLYRFVDDMQGSYHADDLEEFEKNVQLLQDRFRIKQLKTATWMLGMRIERDRKARTITLSQEVYVTKALEKFGLEQCRVVSTPEQVGAASDQQEGLDTSADAQRYMEITGTLMYAAISTRPDIAHAVHYLASHMQAPTQRHMLAAERVLRYLAGTKDVGLVFGSRNGSTVGDSRGLRGHVQVDVCAFADADWANDKGDRRSITGWVAKLNGDPVSWSSKKQRVVALSTCEAELYAEAAAIQEVLWLRGLMEELGLHTRTGSIVHGDNQSTIAVSQNGVKGERTKHVDVKYRFVTETVERGDVTLRWIPTAQQQADIFTKALAAPVFHLLRKELMTR